MNFPKNIFQTWKTKDVPDKWKKGQESVINKNPGWNYVLLTDKDNDRIVKDYFPDFYQTFISFQYPIQRADAIRYCVLYLFGGIYLDLDYICNKSFNDLVLEKEVGLTFSRNTKGVYTNSVLISQPHSEFWLMCIQKMKSPLLLYKKLSKHLRIMFSTGPMMINNIAKKYPNFIQTIDNLHVPCNSCNKVCNQDKKYYLTPIEGKSWNSLDSTLINYIFCNKRKCISVVTILIVILIIIKFKLF